MEVKESPDYVVEKIVGMYDDSRRYFKTIRDDMIKYYKQYRGILDVDTTRDYYKWRSKLFIPATAKAVDGILPDLMLNLFASDPFFSLGAREPGDIDQARAQEALLPFQFENCDFFSKFYTLMKQWAMYGTTFGKCFWSKETIKEKFKVVTVDDFGNSKEVELEKEITLKDQPWFEPIDFFSLTWGKKAISLSDTWVIHRTEKSLRDLKNSKLYKNISKLENSIISDKISGEYEDNQRRALKGLSAPYNNEEGDDRKIELLEYWNADRTKTMTIAGQSVIVREERDNPYGAKFDPFVCSTLWGMPFELLGIGIPEKCQDVQAQLNSEVNQRLDNRNLRQNVMFKVRRGANINTSNLQTKPGGVWLTDDMTALDVVSIPDTSSSSSFAEENMLEQKIEESTGVTRYSTGAGSATGKTATEVSTLTRMSSKGFALHLKLVEEQLIKPIIKKFMYLNSKFCDKEQFIRVAGYNGQEFIKVTPDDLQKTNYDIIVHASSQLTDKNIKVQQMVQFMQIIAQDPTMVPFKRELTKRIWEAWGNKDFDKIIGQGQVQTQPNQPQIGPGVQGMNGPLEPMGMRPPSPMEGMSPQMLGNGGQNAA